MTFLGVIFLVIGVAAGMVLGVLIARVLSSYFIYHRPWTPLEVLVKDTGKHVSGHKYCKKCAEPLRVNAKSMGYDSESGKEFFIKVGRCDRWRWYHAGYGGHCRRASFHATNEQSWRLEFSAREDYAT
jgi:hypothetical protein